MRSGWRSATPTPRGRFAAIARGATLAPTHPRPATSAVEPTELGRHARSDAARPVRHAAGGASRRRWATIGAPCMPSSKTAGKFHAGRVMTRDRHLAADRARLRQARARSRPPTCCCASPRPRPPTLIAAAQSDRRATSTSTSPGNSRPRASSASPISRATISRPSADADEAGGRAVSACSRRRTTSAASARATSRRRRRRSSRRRCSASSASARSRRRSTPGPASWRRGSCPAPVREQLYRILFKPDKNAPEYKAVVEASRRTHRAPLELLKAAGAIDSPYQFHWRRFLFESFPKGTAFPALAVPAIKETLPLAPAEAFSIDDSAHDRDRRRVVGAGARQRQRHPRHPHRGAGARGRAGFAGRPRSRASASPRSTCPATS